MRTVFPAWLILPAALALAGCEGRSVTRQPAEAPPVAVRTATVDAVQLALFRPVAGTVRPADHAVVSARVLGEVARADLALGRAVAAGEIVVELSAPELDARLTQAEAGLARLRSDLARERTLLAQGAAASDAVRSLADQVAAASALADEARAVRNHTRVAAPFAGVISRRFVNPGDLAAPGAPLFELESRDRLRAEVEVPASLPMLDPGAFIAVRLATGEGRGRLAEIATAVDPASRTRLAKVDLPSSLPAAFGDFARVSWPAGETRALTLPAEAVRLNGQMEQVWIVAEGRASLRLVKTAGPAEAGRLVVSTGLSAGDRVVLAPAAELREGQRLEANLP